MQRTEEGCDSTLNRSNSLQLYSLTFPCKNLIILNEVTWLQPKGYDVTAVVATVGENTIVLQQEGPGSVCIE